MSPTDENLLIIKKITQKILAAEKIAIAGHVDPDGDAVASCLGLALSIKSLNKEAVVLLERIPKRYSFLKGLEFIEPAEFDCEPDLFISCDCATVDRLGSATALFNRCNDTIVVDHHVSNIGYGSINYILPNASSASELIYDIVEELGNMNYDIASILYTGIIFDTGGLRFPSTSPETMNKVSKLMGYNIPFSYLYEKTMLSHSFEEAMVFSQAISRMKRLSNPSIVYSIITLKDIADFGASNDSTGSVVDYLLNTDGIEIAIFIYEKNKNVSKVSFRSRTFDVNKIASNWGGGGHTNAAGCTINLNPYDAVREVLDFVTERYGKCNTME